MKKRQNIMRHVKFDNSLVKSKGQKMENTVQLR